MRTQRTQLRIVAGSLRGRKLVCTVTPNLRPTPQMVREALFSILGNAVPDRTFYDVFAGTGVIGLEALSRGARNTIFVERDFRLVGELERHIAAFGVGGAANIIRSDVYHWMQRWQPPAEAVTVFLSPPFADFDRRLDDMLALTAQLQERLHAGSVLVLQSERETPLEDLPRREEWDNRAYGRNVLQFWVKEVATGADPEQTAS
jgi:16S rRNA (guanine(966)-N(2))-methyltransferase RsmD